MKLDERNIRRVNRFKASPRLKGESWEYYEKWLKGKASGTQSNYLLHFIRFLEFLDKDTEELYNLYLEMIRDEDPRKKKRMSTLVVDYQEYIKEAKGLKSGTVVKMFSALKGFFKANELPFDLTEENIQDDSEEIPNISIGQLRKVLDATGSYKTKAYIKVGRDSGLRTGDMTHLPIGKLREALDDSSIEYYTFEWKQQKTKKLTKPVPANPVIGPDSLDALRAWMNYRVKVLKISAENGDPLFCIERNKAGHRNKMGWKVNEAIKGDWMGDGNMGVIFRQLVRKANLKPLPGETRLPSIHSLRKYHKTTLEYAGVHTSWINKMQGRKGEGTGGIYTKPNPEQLIEMFKKGYSALSGIEEGQQEKVDKLTHELGVSHYEMEEIRKERDKYRAGYDKRARLQGLIDKGILAGWPEEIIKKLEETLESVETFEEGVFEFHKLEKELDENWDFKIVDEEAEMILNTNDGWKVFKALNDGRYVLRRNLSDM